MKISGFVATGLLIWVLIASAPMEPTPPVKEGFTLIHAVPNDVILCVTEKNNPKRAFIEGYWGEVFEALMESGVHKDVIGLFGSLLGQLDQDQTTEMERLKDRALELVDAVDWVDLACKEMVFAEQFIPPVIISESDPPFLMPSMIWLFRGSSDGAARNYKGLTAILEALVEEANNAVGKQMLILERSIRMGTEVTSVDLMKKIPNAPSLPLAIALRDDVIIIGMREHLFQDVLALMEGKSNKTALADTPRFRAAFAKLPPAEDMMTFFDMQNLGESLHATADVIINAIHGPQDCYVNSGMPAAVNGLNGKAMSAYQDGDIEKALAFSRDAYKVAPENPIILYNLACFNALAGNRDAALDWLDKAVEGGFYASKRIGRDADFKSLQGEPAFKAALAKAADLARKCNAKDIAINFAEEGEVYRLRMQVNQTYETKDYEQGLKLIKQAYAIDPKDSKVVYTLACLHTLLGHEAEGLDILDQAVDAGFYCPNHMSKDPDLESVRGKMHFEAAVAKARQLAGEMGARKQKETVVMVKRVVKRLMNAVTVLDYSAAVQATDGYTTTMETLVTLMPDAKERPIYPVFGNNKPMTDFERYLPQETASFSISGGVDVGAIYTFIEDTVRLAGAPGKEALAKWEGIQKQIGFNLKKDVIDWIQGDSIEVTLADGAGSVMLIKVHDEKAAQDKMKAAIEFFTTKLGEVVRKKPELAGLAMLGLRTSKVKHAELEGFQNIHFSMSPQPAVWGVKDGYLIFGSTADAIALCLATARGEHDSIKSNERAMSEMIVPDGPFAGVSLTDMRGLGAELEQGIGIATMVTGMMGAFVPDPEVRPVIAKISGILGKLTPVVKKIDFYKSSAMITTFDGLSWRVRDITHYFSPEERTARGL